jgi:hypothetical protein
MGSGYNSTGETYSHSDREPDGTGHAGQALQTALDEADGETDDSDNVEDCYEDHVAESGITDRQGKTISERRDVLVEILREDLNIEDSQLIGSFTRGTMTGPLDEDSDADVMVVLDSESHRQWIDQENGPRNCLNAIKRRIENDPRFSETEVRVNQNVVQVKYHDSTVEIAPAFRYRDVPHADHPRQRGFNLFNDASDGYAIPDTHGRQSWQGTNPRKYKQMFEARDEAHNGRVSGLTRAMKKWTENNDVPVRSYHMETMVYNYFEDKSRRGERVPDSYEELTRDFMDTMSGSVRQPTKEPVYGEQVDSGMNKKDRRRAADQAAEAAQKLKEAKRLKEEGDVEAAKKKLNEVHGEGFN